MSDGSPVVRSGHCLCKAVRFRVTGEPKWVAHCWRIKRVVRHFARQPS
jgi:hypothetical protein